MPQQRTLLHAAPAWKIERVLKHASPVQWSPPYAAASGRWVLPLNGVSEFQMAGQVVLLDGLTALGLPQGLAYRMKPLQPTEQSSIVVSEQEGRPVPLACQNPSLQVRTFTPRALWRLRMHWRALADGRPMPGWRTASDVLQTGLEPGAAAQDCAVIRGASGRALPLLVHARRFMAQRVAAADGEPWSLHDVADAAGCSAFHLAHLFRRHLGLGLHGYRQSLRMAATLQRLDAGESDLAALAHDLGYSSQSHLGSVFRREVGVTLAQARSVLQGHSAGI
ncbi:helix-turn-helix transcriptional regulator [Acidovorax sp.]|uniref:helix-turn-helix transcriptional regulator n=1 Tax=Acidovorax sp. TaxID=1872122 RepID=UPI0026168339|nr:helix-turn-helix transcriptional regulator [Acidovorax sp.]